MPAFKDLPSPKQMQRIVTITYFDHGNRGTLTLAPEQKEESSTFVPWFGDDDKLLIGPRREMETVLSLMEKITGHEFRKISTRGKVTTWERVDFHNKNKVEKK